MVMGMLKMQDPDEITFQSINFNFYTTSAVLQVSTARGLRQNAHVRLFARNRDAQVAEYIFFSGGRVRCQMYLHNSPKPDVAQ